GDLYPKESPEDVNRQKLLAALKVYMQIHNMETDWGSVEQAPSESLVNSLSMICPFEPAEKQALLEAATVTARSAALEALMRMSAAADGQEASRLQ
ncbi:MAG: peptidase S16, partial [Caulobacterales bacterium]|nr:peptidase S16 [Caulobacterales bacterium]